MSETSQHQPDCGASPALAELSDHYGQDHSLYGNLEFRTRTRGEEDVSLTRTTSFVDIAGAVREESGLDSAAGFQT